MEPNDALLAAFRTAAPRDAAAAVEDILRGGADEDLVGINPVVFARDRGLGEDTAIAAFLHATRLGLFEMSWNVLCPSCSGVLDANATLKTVRDGAYHCAFCSMDNEPTLDEGVEVSFTVSPRVRRIAAHDPASLGFWDYHRQAFFGSGVVFPGRELFAELAGASVLEALELGARERMILALQLPDRPVVIFDPVTHTAEHIDTAGETTRERQELSLVFGAAPGLTGRVALRPGPLRVSLDNRTDGRVLPGAFVLDEGLMTLLGGRGPFLTAKRLLSNQTFRDLYRTETLDIDQRLKITSLTFLFTDLTGSTELYEQVGDLVAYELVRAHFRILNEIVSSVGGAVVKTIGDAVMATFPAPDQAVAAAMRMREAMQHLNRERAGHADLILRIGIHAGPCLAVSLNDRQDYFGQTVNIASRVQELAGSDAIFATEAVVGHEATAALLRERGAASRSHRRQLRGIGDRLAIFELA